MKKLVFFRNKIISTSEKHAEHLFPGQNTQQQLHQTSVLYFNFRDTFSEKNRLTGLNLSMTFCHKTCTRPPSCNTPQQLTVYGNSFLCTIKKIPDIWGMVPCGIHHLYGWQAIPSPLSIPVPRI